MRPKLIKLVKTGNEVNFYYYRTVDSRKEATVRSTTSTTRSSGSWKTAST